MSGTDPRLQAVLNELESLFPNHFFDRHGHPLDFLGWADLHRKEEYIRVAYVELYGIAISTVWLGINHSYTGEGAPIIFETMLFGWAPMDGWTTRYETEAQALAGHLDVFNALVDGTAALAMARTIPNGRQRHGRIKFIRDLRRHYVRTGMPGSRDYR